MTTTMTTMTNAKKHAQNKEGQSDSELYLTGHLDIARSLYGLCVHAYVKMNIQRLVCQPWDIRDETQAVHDAVSSAA